MELRRRDLDADPLRQFERWYAEAGEWPERMAVATADAGGAPSVRMVLLKSFDERGLVFYSHYPSRKGRELAGNPRAALLFYWEGPGRQVRVEGGYEPVEPGESDAYFATRPLGARLGAHASRQSEPVASRAELERRLEQLAGRETERPEWWGGFRVVPAAWEFWQHRDDRLHDRFRYTRAGGGWTIERLQP